MGCGATKEAPQKENGWTSAMHLEEPDEMTQTTTRTRRKKKGAVDDNLTDFDPTEVTTKSRRRKRGAKEEMSSKSEKSNCTKKKKKKKKGASTFTATTKNDETETWTTSITDTLQDQQEEMKGKLNSPEAKKDYKKHHMGSFSANGSENMLAHVASTPNLSLLAPDPIDVASATEGTTATVNTTQPTKPIATAPAQEQPKDGANNTAPETNDGARPESQPSEDKEAPPQLTGSLIKQGSTASKTPSRVGSMRSQKGSMRNPGADPKSCMYPKKEQNMDCVNIFFSR